jgi:malonate decarboxylase gamma subunit
MIDKLLKEFFPEGFEIEKSDSIITGMGKLNGHKIALIGTFDNAFIGAKETLVLSGKLMEIIKNEPGCPILMLVDNNGQTMSLQEELLGLPQYIGHLLSVQDFARRNGHKIISVVYGNAIAGGFIAFGMGAPSRIYATESATPSVMNLPAISRVTKLPLEELEELAKTVPVFAPGHDNFFKMGGLHEIWSDDLSGKLQEAFDNYSEDDNRAELAMNRGGRNEAFNVINEVINA